VEQGGGRSRWGALLHTAVAMVQSGSTSRHRADQHDERYDLGDLLAVAAAGQAEAAIVAADPPPPSSTRPACTGDQRGP
jgi:hypothetical protein